MGIAMHGLAGGRPLNPFGDVTVSKGFARREHAGTVDALPFVSDLMARAARPAYARFTRKRRLHPPEVAACVADFGRLLDDLADTVGRYDFDVAATRARPRSEYHERARLCVSRDERDFRLVSVSLGINAKRFYFEASPTVLGWTRHAAERCYERIGGTARTGEVIGRAMTRQLPMASLAIEAVQARRGACDLAIPAGGGLLLGQVHEVAEIDWEGRYALITADGANAGRRPPTSTLPPAPCPGSGAGRTACWKAVTYIGPDEMRPEQEEYAAAWLDVGDRAGLVDDGPLASQLIALRHFGPDALARHRADSAQVAGWLAEFLDAPDYAGFMGRTPYPASLPAPPAADISIDCLRDMLGTEAMAKGGWQPQVKRSS